MQVFCTLASHLSNGELTEEVVLKQYADVFGPTGKFPGECHIEIHPNTKPVQHVPRCVPVSLRDAVRNKLDDMEKRKVIMKVTEPTNWISSMVFKVKVGVLRPVQQPGSYWDRSSELPLVGLEPTEVTAYD